MKPCTCGEHIFLYLKTAIICNTNTFYIKAYSDGNH